jgi:carbon-monoxide dehydrogenase large subunit
MSILGNRVVRTEDPRFLAGGGMYMADLTHPLLDGAAYVTYVRSTIAHARLEAVDTSEALGADGVLAVLTAADVDLDPYREMDATRTRPWLATDRVRFVGEPIAAIVTERPEQGADAAEAVWGDYDPLPAVTDLEEARRDETLLFPDTGTNVVVTFGAPAADDLFDGCDVVVRRTINNQRVAACPLEVRGAAAAWDTTDPARPHLTMWCSTQHAHGVRDTLMAMYGLEREQVRVVAPDVGGGFGPKIGAHPEDLLLPYIARTVGRPVRWHETRTENMLAMGHGRGQQQTVAIGGTRDGTVLAYHLEVLADAGGYPSLGAFLPYLTRQMAPGTYDIPRAECHASSVVTNTMSTRAYRGAGRPEATAAIERAMDLFAHEIGMDPAEVRRRNLVAADRFPFTNTTGATYDCGDYERALDLVLDASGYDALRAEQQRRRDAGDPVQLGIGVSCYVEVTAGPTAEGENARVEITEGGGAVVYTGTSPHGQGHHTAFAMIASDVLGIPMDDIRVVHGDTDAIADGGGTSGSRSLQLGGSAVASAAGGLVDEGRKRAADLLDVAPDDVQLDTDSGEFRAPGASSSVTWRQLRDAAGDEGLVVSDRFDADAPTFPFGAHVAVVEVDTETGAARLVRMVTADDAGRVLNPLLVEGQRCGGIAQGAAQALYEEFHYDADGNPQTANFADYGIVSAAELPSFELLEMETPTPLNPLGAKGIGESGTIGSTPAVQSAVVDAVSHLGITHIDMPCTPARVWAAIDAGLRP